VFSASLFPSSATRHPAVGIFGGYFDTSALNEHDRRTMDDFFKRLGKRYEILDHRNKGDVVRFGKLLREKLS
jgi:hypothetical protein